MPDNVQTLRNAYDAFARGDVATVMAAFDESIEWTVPDVLPFGGTYHGPEAVGGFFASLPAHWEDLRVEPQEFIGDGDRVAVLIRLSGRGAAGRLDGDSVHIWQMRDGKAVSFREYPDTARVLEALGQPAVAAA
jgi:ketosteroid isomerase-like protein